MTTLVSEAAVLPVVHVYRRIALVRRAEGMRSEDTGNRHSADQERQALRSAASDRCPVIE